MVYCEKFFLFLLFVLKIFKIGQILLYELEKIKEKSKSLQDYIKAKQNKMKNSTREH